MLNKNSTLHNLYIELLEDENPLLWEYFASVVIKHALVVSSEEERKQFAIYIREKKDAELDRFIELKLPLIISLVREEVVQTRRKTVAEIKKDTHE
jgi:hypothetical protein